MLADYHVHSLGHQDRNQSLANLESFVVQGIRRGIKEIGFSDHDWVDHRPDFFLFQKLQEKYPTINIRVGIEIDHMIGREDEIASTISDLPYDFVLGGVHHLGAERWAFDLPEYRENYWGKNIDELYQEYFKTVKHAVLSGLYQIIPHIDLIKIFGYRPEKAVLSLMGDLLEIIKEKSLAVEINTNGLYKPVSEIYPSKDILKECFRLGIPITIGSDAHHHREVGRNFDTACALAYEIGYREIATFQQKELILRSLDDRQMLPEISINIA